MQPFAYKNPTSLNEAVAMLQAHNNAKLLAGGSDLIGGLKDNLWMEYPEAVINLKSIAGLDEIVVTDQGLEIGALATLTAIAENEDVQKGWFGLAKAASLTASPLLRNMGTISGNICQENRCWYYRYPDKLGGRIDCVRKGGKRCLAVPGDHRYHSIFGAVNKCIAVNPSDTAPAIIALDGKIITTKRTIAADEFFSAAHGAQSTILEHDEIVTKIVLPPVPEDTGTAFQKIAHRKSIDFALVNCAAMLTVKNNVISETRICLNGVYNDPVRSNEAEAFLKGKAPNKEAFVAAGELAVENARPLLANGYKVNLAKTIIADTLAACFDQLQR